MQYQEPAEGICLDKNFDTAKFYTVFCDCGDENHRIKLIVEVDESCNQVIVTQYTNVKSCWWNQQPTRFDFINRIAHVLYTTWKLWTKGYIECESSVILNEQVALNFSEILKKSISDLKNIKEKKSII
jgi:hypothetical protein